MKYIHIRINELLEEKGISKNRICKDLDLPRGNFNKYCRDNFQRIDANLIIRLCDYFGCEISDLLEIREKEEEQ
ncbi:helix-turn-helix domain-containing protein [Schaedlerella arabinosiphila]|uniref:helix-turn-helix domain-containing protein n=1 Tax=Schaedlerella arabinosiphila TaxID=2044587 RepID=UPI002557ECB1|nr:helix-turn-helix transcriptional regulator [Schaedlerella arabinosiphila]